MGRGDFQHESILRGLRGGLSQFSAQKWVKSIKILNKHHQRAESRLP